MPNTYSPSNLLDQNDYIDFLKIHSVTYNVDFYFLAYAFKMTENLNIRWNEQTVFGRMDPIPTYKGMGRTMTISFQARQKMLDGSGKPYKQNFEGNELLHDIDHIKKCLYPRYDANSVMISPPLFRFAYKNLISAGENTNKEIKDPTHGVLGYITSFAANPLTDPNKIYFPSVDRQYAFPKVFDVNFTFTVLNEDLVRTQQEGILNERYFYDYKTHFHKESEDAAQEQVSIKTTAGEKSTDPKEQATLDMVLDDPNGMSDNMSRVSYQSPYERMKRNS
jgi:hypothetical protein